MTDARDLVLVTVDSLRTDRCGFLGSTRGLTPTMDRLAEQGLVYENAIAPAGSTRGSSTSFFTGHYPIDRPTATSRTQTIRQHMDANETLPEWFAQRGYDTAAFTANPWTSRFFNFDQGFERFEDFMEDDLTKQAVQNGDKGSNLPEVVNQLLNWWQGQDMFMSWDSFYDDISEWLDRSERPFFLWIFLVDVHMPFIPPREYQSQSTAAAYAANTWLFADRPSVLGLDAWFERRLRRAYDDTVRYTDEFVGRLAAELDDETLLCVHADHGEMLGEHDHIGHGLLHEEIINVPLFVANHPQNRVTEPFSLRRLPALLTALSQGEDPTCTDPVVTTRNNGGTRVVRGATWRYARDGDEETIEALDGGTLSSHARDELRELARRILAQQQEVEDERRRIIDAADHVARTDASL